MAYVDKSAFIPSCSTLFKCYYLDQKCRENTDFDLVHHLMANLCIRPKLMFYLSIVMAISFALAAVFGALYYGIATGFTGNFTKDVIILVHDILQSCSP